MKNNKGFTVIELISSFVLISLIVALLFEVLFIIKNLYTDSGIKTELLVKQALISEKINDEFNSKNIMVASKCGSTCINFTFTDGTSSELSFDRNENTFKYGNYKTKLIDGSEYGNINVTTETVVDVPVGLNDSVVKIEIPIYHKLIKQQNFGINIVYQYDSRNTAISGLYVSDVVDSEKKIHLIGMQNDIAFTNISYSDPGYYVTSSDGTVTQNDSNVVVNGTVGNEVGKTYTLTYTILDMNDNIMDEVQRNVTVIESTTVFNYNGSSQGYVVPVNGLYKIEVWGAQGGTIGDYSQGGKGGYTVGQINLTKNDTLDIYVGGQGSYSKNMSVSGGFNGGGASGYGSDTSGASGGGASDVRINGSSLENRIIVAGGGGGAGSKNDSSDPSNGGAGGGTSGLIGTYSTTSYNGNPGTSTSGGEAATYATNVTILPTNGTLGIGGNGGSYSDTYGGGGGGAGYYGGGAGVRYGSGAGGSGYCGSMLNCTTYNGTQSFLSADGISSETGHLGNGTVKITLISIKESYINHVMTSASNCINSGVCPNGTLISVQVNDSQNYNFYVIKDTGTELTLIMDRNIGTQVAWYKDDDDATNNETNNLGPITALNYLNSQTSSWTNVVPIKRYIYNNNLNGTKNTYGYQKLEIENGTGKLISKDGSIITTLTGTNRARLLTYEEAETLKTANSNTTPTWLYTNLSSANTIEAPSGYWFLMANPSYSYYGRCITNSGNVINNHRVYRADHYGVRPVITIQK